MSKKINLKEFLFKNIRFPLMPIPRPKEAKSIQYYIKKIFQLRWEFMKKRFNLGETFAAPKLNIIWLILSYVSGYFYFGKRITILAGVIYRTGREISRTIDHEIVHYIQLSVNREIRKKRFWVFRIGYFFGLLHWKLTKKANKFVVFRIFIEGFATFVASKTSNAALTPFVLKGMDDVLNGKISVLTPELSYSVGYLAFAAIAKTS